MLAAEKWYEYQKSYKKYGLEMKPACTEKKAEQCRSKVSGLSAKDKIRLLVFTVFMGLLCVCLIVTTAFAAQIKLNTNTILAETSIVRGEIENLNVAIKSANNISVIEEKAMKELGMIYPEIDQIAFIDTDAGEIPDFALTLKQLAFKM